MEFDIHPTTDGEFVVFHDWTVDCRTNGAAPETASVAKIKAALLVQYAETDDRINEMWPAYDAALTAAGVAHEMHKYPGTQHGFHNNSTPRYNEPAAKLAWERTISFFKKKLA